MSTSVIFIAQRKSLDILSFNPKVQPTFATVAKYDVQNVIMVWHHLKIWPAKCYNGCISWKVWHYFLFSMWYICHVDISMVFWCQRQTCQHNCISMTALVISNQFCPVIILATTMLVSLMYSLLLENTTKWSELIISYHNSKLQLCDKNIILADTRSVEIKNPVMKQI